MYISIDHVPNDIIVYSMPTLSKFLTGQRGGEQLLDSDGFLYNRRKAKDTALSFYPQPGDAASAILL